MQEQHRGLGGEATLKGSIEFGAILQIGRYPGQFKALADAALVELTAEAWRLAGRPLPNYTRATMPIAVATLQDHPGAT